jgi:hypothetical protein
MATAVAPPETSALTEKVAVVPPNAGDNFVAQVTLEPTAVQFENLPERAQVISRSLAKVATGAATPQDRIEFTNSVDQHTKESSAEHPNTQPQWGKMFFAAMDGNWNDVYKYYNGGAVRYEAAKDLNGKVYWKGYNEIGENGVIKNYADKRDLSNKEKEDINARSGLVSQSDQDAIKTLPWINGKINSEMVTRGLTSQLNATTNAAYTTAANASASNHNIDEQIHLIKKTRKILDYFSTLPSDERAKLLGNINSYNTINSNKANERAKAVGASGSDLVGLSNTANVKAGIGADGSAGGVVPPSGSNISASGGMGAAGNAQTTNTANARDATTASASSGQTIQDQRNLQSSIMAMLQGVIKTPQEFQDFARLQALNAQNEADAKNVPDFVKPVGFVNLTGTDIYTGGADAGLMNRVQHQRNNALMAAYSAQLMKAARKVAATGQLVDQDALKQEFAASPLYQAINNTFDEKMNIHLKGQGKHPKGTLMVNESNQLVIK